MAAVIAMITPQSTITSQSGTPANAVFFLFSIQSSLNRSPRFQNSNRISSTPAASHCCHFFFVTAASIMATTGIERR